MAVAVDVDLPSMAAPVRDDGPVEVVISACARCRSPRDPVGRCPVGLADDEVVAPIAVDVADARRRIERAAERSAHSASNTAPRGRRDSADEQQGGRPMERSSDSTADGSRGAQSRGRLVEESKRRGGVARNLPSGGTGKSLHRSGSSIEESTRARNVVHRDVVRGVADHAG
jgi:hypothetical protein